MRRAIAFLIGLSLFTTLLWSFAFPVITADHFAWFHFKRVAFVPVWRGWGETWATGWLLAEFVVCVLVGVGAACFVPSAGEETRSAR